jgi:hypothetical protein
MVKFVAASFQLAVIHQQVENLPPQTVPLPMA